MVIINGKEISIDLSHTIYDSLNLPENEEEIVERIRFVRDSILNGKLRDQGGVLARFGEKYTENLSKGLEEYDKTKDLNSLLRKYSWVDLMVKKCFLKDSERNGEITSKELHDTFAILRYNWAIISNPETRRLYDQELEALREIQAIEDEHERKCVLRNRIAKEECVKAYGTDSFDRSYLGGASIVDEFGKTPTYTWGMREYVGGKKLIMSTETHYKGNPDLDQKVEIFAHGEFLWSALVRKDADGVLKSSYEDPLCEVISVKKTDKDGRESVSYGIAQTRDLGYFDKLNEFEILDLERKGIEVIYIAEPEESKRLAELRRLEELRKRRRKQQPSYKVVRVTKPTSFGEKLVRFNRYLDIIGMEIPNMFIPKETIEKRIPIAGASESIREFVPRSQRDVNKKYDVMVMDPRRYVLDPVTGEEFARIQLADFALEEDKRFNGYFFGSLATNANEVAERLLDETIKACQYSTVNPGYVITSSRANRTFSARNIGEALEYFAKRDRAREEYAKRVALPKKNDSIDFYGE